MKSFILAALIGLSTLAAGTITASADSLPVHGYQGTAYGK